MSNVTYKSGDRIRHHTLGDGTVLGFGSLSGGTIIICFDRGGVKELLLAFAASRLEPCDTVAPEIE